MFLDKSPAENKTRFMFSNILSGNRAIYEITWRKIIW